MLVLVLVLSVCRADLTGLSELFLQRTERGTYSSAEHTHLSVCRYSKFVPDAGRPVGLVSGSGSPRWHLLHDS